MDEEIQESIEIGRSEHQERVFFAEQGLGTEVHWFLRRRL